MSLAKKLILASVGIVLIIAIIAMILFIPRSSGGYADDTWYGAESFDINKIAKVEKSADKDFKILAITDVQFDNPFKSKKQLKSDLKKMVDSAKPDIIVTVGDNFAGLFNHFHVDAFTKMMDGLGVPWAPIYGNHERDFSADLVYLARIMQKSELCMFKIGPTNIDGVGNYIINIEESGVPICSLVMMDCNEEIFLKDAKGKRVGAYYESPRHSQVEWYKDNIKGITESAGKVVPSILFTHTPLPEFAVANKLYEAKSNEVEYITGELGDGGMCEGKINYGLFDAALELGSTKNMFFGHDHGNTLGLKYKGIEMAYAVKTGNFSSYIEGKTGATSITIKSGGIIEWNQLYIAEML